ncbi:hypothetical protein SDC9_123377 [bioreactor metagenome]|uniref:Uncharacterized protein n=1 Tax=bioreactor metagenome TaxID=1076179 RepID=A0A645CHH8_9ZZZZ
MEGLLRLHKNHGIAEALAGVVQGDNFIMQQVLFSAHGSGFGRAKVQLLQIQRSGERPDVQILREGLRHFQQLHGGLIGEGYPKLRVKEKDAVGRIAYDVM